MNEIQTENLADISDPNMKVAILGPSFFGYLQTLAERLNERGIQTEFYDERGSNSLWTKLKLRFLPKFIGQRQLKPHHDAIAADIRQKGITHILVVTCEVFPLETLRALQDDGIGIHAYCLDSFANKPHMRAISKIAKNTASFDPDDCANEGFVYIPNYSNLTQPEIIQPISERPVDFLFFGTLHSNRPYWISRVKSICKTQGWKANLLLFFHSKLLWYLRFATSPNVWHLGKNLKTVAFPKSDVNAASLNAKVVVDIQHPAQSGLTMRVFEAISCGNIVITPNKNIGAVLPSNLVQERVRTFDETNLEQVMKEALSLSPSELSEKDRYFLSEQRNIDQLIEFMSGQAPPEDNFTSKNK